MKMYGNSVIDYGFKSLTDNRYKSARSERSSGFCMSAKPEKPYFNGHEMPVIGEIRGLRRNPIKFRVIFIWNKEFTGGIITAVSLENATKKDKQSLFVSGDVMQMIQSVVDFIKTEA